MTREEYAWFPHSKTGEKIYGQHLQHKDLFEKNDLHNHPDGWVKIPESSIGCAVPKDSEVTYIRPFTCLPFVGGKLSSIST